MKDIQLFFIDQSPETQWNPTKITPPGIIGRVNTCHLKIDHESISTQHAQVIQEGNEFILVDLESTNGTRIAGNKISKQKLEDGQEVSFGMVKFLIRIVSKPLPKLCSLENERAISLSKMPFSIGRESDNELALKEVSVSSHHAVIYEENGHYFIEDKLSTNGTRVNDRRIQKLEIKDHDVIRVGNWKAIFITKEESKSNFFLKFLDGERAGEKISLDEKITIGRTKDNDISIPTKAVSSHHAEVFLSQGNYWIKDLDSLNGVRIGGVKVKKALLKHDDEIILGNTSLLFENAHLAKERFFLVIIDGERGGEELEITSQITFGRSSINDVPIKEHQVSNIHAKITMSNNVFTLEDKNSTNGTYLNQKKITTPSTLKHGDEIQIGPRHFIFRSSAKGRPKVISEESYSLVPVLRKGYGKTIDLSKGSVTIGRHLENDLTIKGKGISHHHARIVKEKGHYFIQDTNSRMGTFVNGKKIVQEELEHGDEINIGKRAFIFKSSLRPLHHILGMSYELSLSMAAGALFLLFCFYMIANSFFASTDPILDNDTPKIVQEEKEVESDQDILGQTEKDVQSLLRSYQYGKARQKIQDTLQTIKLLSNKTKLEEAISKIKSQELVFEEVVQKLQRPTFQPIRVEVPEKGVCLVRSADPKTHTLMMETSQKDIILEVWEKLPPTIFFQIAEQLRVSSAHLYALAEMAHVQNLPGHVEKYLVLALNHDSSVQAKADQLYSKSSGQKIPLGGFTPYQGRLVSLEEKRTRESQDKQKQEQEDKENQARQLRENRIKAQEMAKQREKDEFPLRYAIIDELSRTYSYEKAISEFEKFLEQLISNDLKDKVRRRIAEVKPMAELFRKLIDSINQKKLLNDRIKISTDVDGVIAEADEDTFRVIFPQGALKEKWYHLPPNRVYQFFERLKVEGAELFLIGVFCFENELSIEGNRSFIKVIRNHPKLRKKVDQYLSLKFDIPIPKGGFVPYQGRLISPKEREYLAKGLVRHGSKWVTPEDKEMLEQGFIKHNGKWITGKDKQLLARGYQQYKGKWYTKKELQELRQNWDDAWTLSTQHYELSSNISEEFLKELGTILEASYVEYAQFFGERFKSRSTLYAFRTFEDYRRFCIESGNPSLVRAGGFATKQDNRAVGWKRFDNDQLLSTMIHEGAHLYMYNAHPNTSTPSWMAEGIATQFEGYEWDGKKLIMHHRSPNRLPWVKRKFLEGNTFTIEELIQGQALQLINQDIDQAATFYAQSWALYYYMKHIPNKQYRDNFDKFVSTIHRGGQQGRESTIFMNYFGRDIDKLNIAWKKYILDLK